MEEQVLETIDPVMLQNMEYMGIVAVISLIILVATIIYSVKKGGFKEVVENIFLWFLLSNAFLQISMYPVDADDEVTAAIYFVAFGVCRIAKHMARKTEEV